MGKDIQLTGIAVSYDPNEIEIQAENTSPILPLDLIKLLEESNTSNILSIEFVTTILGFKDIGIIPSYNLTETQIESEEISLLPSYDLTEQDTREINNTEVLSFELRDYDTASLEYKIVLEFFNETGGVF